MSKTTRYIIIAAIVAIVLVAGITASLVLGITNAINFKNYTDFTSKTYTINVQKSAIDDSSTKILYNTNDGFTQYGESRNGYDFVGLVYDDILYTYDEEKKDYLSNTVSLSSIINSQDLNEVNVVASWKCKYPNFSLVIDGISNYDIDGDNGNYEVFGKIGEKYEIISDIQQYIVFEDKIGENYYNTDSDIMDLAFGKYEGIYRQTGFDTGVYEKVELKQQNNIKIYVNNRLSQAIPLTLTKDVLSFNTIFTLLKMSDIEISTVTKITITFEFVLSQEN